MYKKAMDLTIYVEKIVRNFSRYHKYTLGSELREKSRSIVALIIKTNSSMEKVPLLFDLRDKLEELKVLIRICKEVKAFKRFNSFVYAFELGLLASVASAAGSNLHFSFIYFSFNICQLIGN